MTMNPDERIERNQLARIEQLEADLAKAKDRIECLILRDNTWKKITEQRDKQLASMATERDRLYADAMRYRFIRDNPWNETDLDAVIKSFIRKIEGR